MNGLIEWSESGRLDANVPRAQTAPANRTSIAMAALPTINHHNRVPTDDSGRFSWLAIKDSLPQTQGEFFDTLRGLKELPSTRIRVTSARRSESIDGRGLRPGNQARA